MTGERETCPDESAEGENVAGAVVDGIGRVGTRGSIIEGCEMVVSWVIGLDVIGSGLICSVVIGSVVIGSVVIGSVVIGSVVIGSVGISSGITQGESTRADAEWPEGSVIGVTACIWVVTRSVEGGR